MIKQTIITRTETKYEKFDEFINRITNFLNNTEGEIISVSYPNCNTSVITYKQY